MLCFCFAAMICAGCQSYSPEQLVDANKYRHDYTIESEYTAVSREIYHQAQTQLPLDLLFIEHWPDIRQYRLVLGQQRQQGEPGLISLRDIGGLIEVEQSGSCTVLRTWAVSRWYAEKYVDPIVSPVIADVTD